MLLYSKCTSILGDKYQLDIYRASDHQHVRMLTQSVNSMYISACRHASSQWIAITDSVGTMDIYTANFTHHCRLKLKYQPQRINAVSVVRDYIIVARHAADELYIYSWSGRKLLCVKLEGGVQGIGCGGEGQIQVHTWHGDDYLHVYSIE